MHWLSPKSEYWPAFLLLALHAALAGHALIQHNPTIDESGHLLSGLLAWRRGDLTYYYVNPPLAKVSQTVPLLPAELELPSQPGPPGPDHWRDLRYTFLDANHGRYLSVVPFARSVNVLFSLAVGWLVYRWSRELFGAVAGLIALSLWALCPNALAWAGVCTVDLGATCFGLAAVVGLRGYFRRPGAATTVWAGLLLGFAQLAKFSLLVLYPVTVLLWVVVWWRGRWAAAAEPRPRWHHLLVLLLVSLLVINMGYGFQATGRPLGGFLFKCHALSGGEGWGNRFRNTWLEGIPTPLPAAYVLGLDEQKSHADRGFTNYLCGEWKHGGWWYYYLVAAVVKVPLGTWLLGASALLLACLSQRFRAASLEEGLLWLPALAIVALVSSQTGINGHFRYALPAFPFLFIGISRVGRVVEGAWSAWRSRPTSSRRRPALGLLAAGVILGCLAWNAVAAARTHPHYLSYFNELAGGPDNGWRWLAESNIDWGQDLLFLKAWLADHPEAAGSLRLVYYGGVPPHLLGVDAPPIPPEAGPQPGWYAVSANAVVGMAFFSRDAEGRRQWHPSGAYLYFRRFTPVAKAGYSIFIYHITPEQANAVRRELGLPPLPPAGGPP
jgi:hypothetical protein